MKTDLFEEVIERGADFSDDGLYRYSLWRRWNDKPFLVFIMLNPSTANADTNDPTVERCERRAKACGFGGLHVANLMAYRSTDPRALRELSSSDRFGPRNSVAIEIAMEGPGAKVVCGWGAHGRLGPVAWLTALAARKNVPLWCLGTTKGGEPIHPLYVPYDRPFTWYGGAPA